MPPGDLQPSAATAGLDPEEAFCAIACLAMYQDGAVLQEEQERLMHYLSLQGVFRRQGRRVSRPMLEKVNRLAQEHGDRWLMAQAADALPPVLAVGAYFAAYDLMLSDHALHHREEAYLGELADALAIAAEDRERVRRVAEAKNVAWRHAVAPPAGRL